MDIQFKRLREPLRIGSMVAKNRLWFAPAWTRFSTATGEVTNELIDHYVARARGGIGLITQEATAVDGRHVWHEPQIGIWDNKFIAGLYKLVEAVHRYNCPIVCQIHHAGMFGTNPVAPSDVPCFDFGCQSYIQPRALSLEECEEIRDMFIAAAIRAKKAGYDGVEIHGSTAYLLEQFFSPHNNRRTDKYGGDRERRMNMSREIVRGCRAALGPDYPIFYTLADCDYIPDGIKREDSVAFAKALECEGISCIDLQLDGTYETFHKLEAPGTVRRQRKGQIDLTGKYKKELKVPVVVRGAGLYDPAAYEEALEKGELDAVRMARQFFADPDFTNKVLDGDIDEVRPCIQCVECFEHGVNREWQCACTVNYAMGRGDRPIKRAMDSKNVIVVGAGPGGLEAAMVAAKRGHKVTLMEKGTEVGGLINVATKVVAKDVIKKWVDWAERQCRQAGVKIEFKKEATPDMILKAKPDAVVIATGAAPTMPPIPGIDGPNVVTAEDVLMEKTTVGKKVVVCGGGMVGMETADFILERAGDSKDVTLVEQLPSSELAHGMPAMDRACFLLEVIPKLKLKIHADTLVEEITEKGVSTIDTGWNRRFLEADTVVIAFGYTAQENDLYASLKGKVPDLYIIGDAVKADSMFKAIHDGAYFAREI